ncbi:hypothetical protein H5410_030895 [Solanum commersonii]|uniref:Uncharacterized protein n=1 Tax=Solanum commersonii TaxID=4109 RepID=A0A9J5YHI9_SOLCO|nr:hypothetical protein H5410_030895 [Solanum commersonii]
MLEEKKSANFKDTCNFMFSKEHLLLLTFAVQGRDVFICMPRFILFGKSPSKSASTLTLAQFGLVLFFVAKSTCNGFPTAASRENNASSPKQFGGKAGKKIQAIVVDVSSNGSKHGSHLSVRIGYDI